MAQRFNPLSGTFDSVLDRAVEISVDDSSFTELSGTDIQAVLDSVDNVIAALPDPIYYAGTWDASTNTPTLDNTDTGVTGALYQVNVAGSVDFGAGSISFEIGDRVVNNGTEWQKWDMTDAVTSVNGATGVVVLDTDDISEGVTNLYFTDARAQGAITGGASSIVTSNLASNLALVSNGSGKVAVSSVTSTELGYVSGATSNLQLQIDAHDSSGISGSVQFSDGAGAFSSDAANFLWNNTSKRLDIGAPPFTDNSKLILSGGTNANVLQVLSASGGLNGGISFGTLSTSAFIQGTRSDGLNVQELRIQNQGAAPLVLGNAGGTVAISSGTTTVASDLNMQTHKVTNVVDPTSNQDAATKAYVDTQDTATQTASNAYTDLQTRTNYLRDYFDGTSVTGITSSNGGLTTTLNTSTPLRGTSSQRASKDAANRQNEYWNIPLSAVDLADREGAKPQILSFTYKTSANYASSDIQVRIYDTTNAAYVDVASVSDPDGYLLASSAASNKFVGTWYPVSTSSDYEVRLFVATTNASAYDIDVVDLKCAPDQVVPGAIVTEWQSYTPIWSSSGIQPSIGNGNLLGWWRRVGGQMELKFYIGVGSTTSPGTGNYYLSLPDGHSIDTTFAFNPQNFGFGRFTFHDTNNAIYHGSVRYLNPTTLSASPFAVSGANVIAQADWAAGVPMSLASSDEIFAEVTIPIVGWSASAALSTTETILQTPAPVVTQSAEKTPTGDNWHQLSGNSLTLAPGRYQLGGSVFYAAAAATGYSAFQYLWGITNGADTSTQPTLLSSGSGVTVYGSESGNVTQLVTDNYKETGLDLIVDLKSTTTIYLNAYSAQTTPANARIWVNFYARKLPDFSVFSQYNVVDRQYDLTLSGPTGWSTTRAVGIPYMTADGAWRLKFNFAGTQTSGNNSQVQFSGITFKNGYRQSITANDDSGGSAPSNCFAESNTNYVHLSFGSAYTQVNCSGDVELDSKPTFVP